MILNRKTALYFRHWFPRTAGLFERTEFGNSTHYGFLWLGVIRYK